MLSNKIWNIIFNLKYKLIMIQTGLFNKMKIAKKNNVILLNLLIITLSNK